MTFRAIFYDRHGHVSPPPALSQPLMPNTCPTLFSSYRPITYHHDGHDPEGRHIYRERACALAVRSEPEDSSR